MLPDVLFVPLEQFFISDSTFQILFFSLLVLRTFNPNPDKINYLLHRTLFGGWFISVSILKIINYIHWESVWYIGIFLISFYTIIMILRSIKQREKIFGDPHPDFFFLQPKTLLLTGLAITLAYIINIATLVLKPILEEDRFVIQDLTLLISVLIISIALVIDLSERSSIVQIKQQKLMKEITNVNKELKSFAYVISNELKAPLRSINANIGWLEEYCKEKITNKEKSYFNSIKGQTIRMSNFIDDVLAYSQATIDEEEKILIDLNSVVNEVIMLLNIPSYIEIVITKPLPTVFFGQTRIKQVFLNLLHNAIKYIEIGTGKIIIDYQEIKGNKRSFYEFSIKDNGIGIKEKNFEEIFDLFVTLRKSERIIENRNTGLGLAIVKKIIENYDGKIWVESEYGKGSTFNFTLWKD